MRRGEPARQLPHRELAEAWEAALEAAGVPLLRSDGGRSRPRVVFAAPVPVGMLAEREPIELLLGERRTIADLRPRVIAALPIGHELVDLHDVWVGAPSLAGQVVAADYRVALPGGDPGVVTGACARLLEADRLDRQRAKGEGVRRYDLRPLVRDVAVRAAGRDGEPQLVMRLRHDPALGVGRPQDVLDVLAGMICAAPLAEPARSIVRERVWLHEDLPRPGALPPIPR